jgi:hypothetical protein
LSKINSKKNLIMGKVLQLKLFQTQIVIRIVDEPICISRGPGQSVLVATAGGSVEVHQIFGGRSSLQTRFKTVCSKVYSVALLSRQNGGDR